MNTFVNLTAHDIYEVTTGQKFPASGRVARVKTMSVTTDTISSIPIYDIKFGEIQGLPDPADNTIYIVSALTLKAVPEHRTDVVAPGSVQRNEHGQVIGCVGFRAKD